MIVAKRFNINNKLVNQRWLYNVIKKNKRKLIGEGVDVKKMLMMMNVCDDKIGGEVKEEHYEK